MRRFIERNRRFLGFFLGSGIGVLLDMSVFGTLTHVAGFPPWLANTISATLGIITVYLLVTRHAFRVAGHWLSFVLFIGWYAGSIALFSWIINTLVHEFEFLPLVAKISTLPFSFGLNFLFSRFLFARFS